MITKSPARVETVTSVFVFVTGVTGPRPHVFEICLLFSSHLTCSTELISSLEIFLSCIFPLTPCILIIFSVYALPLHGPTKFHTSAQKADYGFELPSVCS